MICVFFKFILIDNKLKSYLNNEFSRALNLSEVIHSLTRVHSRIRLDDITYLQ